MFASFSRRRVAVHEGRWNLGCRVGAAQRQKGARLSNHGRDTTSFVSSSSTRSTGLIRALYIITSGSARTPPPAAELRLPVHTKMCKECQIPMHDNACVLSLILASRQVAWFTGIFMACTSKYMRGIRGCLAALIRANLTGG